MILTFDSFQNAELAQNKLHGQGVASRSVALYNKNLLVTSPSSQVEIGFYQSLAGFKDAIDISTEYQLSTRKFRPENSQVKIGNDLVFGSNQTIMMAGPCAIESLEQGMETAKYLKETHNVRIFRAGAFKPRTSPYSFQGLKESGLSILKKIREECGMFIITEVKDESHLNEVAEVADIIQVGTKAMYNFTLLEKCGKLNKPILLKRGFMSTLKEFLQAADAIMASGNSQVMLCERGIRTFEPQTRFCLDIGGAALLREISHLPIVMDPSHAIGIASLVPDLATASAALGIDGLLVETHPNPAESKSDREQALSFESFTKLRTRVERVCKAVDRVYV